MLNTTLKSIKTVLNRKRFLSTCPRYGAAGWSRSIHPDVGHEPGQGGLRVARCPQQSHPLHRTEQGLPSLTTFIYIYIYLTLATWMKQQHDEETGISQCHPCIQELNCIIVSHVWSVQFQLHNYNSLYTLYIIYYANSADQQQDYNCCLYCIDWHQCWFRNIAGAPLVTNHFFFSNAIHYVDEFHSTQIHSFHGELSWQRSSSHPYGVMSSYWPADSP